MRSRLPTHLLARLGLLAPIAALAAGCAGAPRTTARPAHGAFDPAQARRATDQAIDALKARGFELAFSDAKRGLILTRQREGQARCGASECLARDTFVVRLERGNATAVLSRLLFDAALRTWVSPHEPDDLDAVEADEVALLSAFLQAPPTLRRSRAGESCADSDSCDPGLRCENRRCSAPRASTPDGRLPAARTKH